jgi:hypothetical protein
MRGTNKNKFGKIEKNAKIKEGECIFPFKYKWKTHASCVDTEKGAICATEVNPETKTLTKYGYCESEEVTEEKPKLPSLKKPSSKEKSQVLKTLKKKN